MSAVRGSVVRVGPLYATANAGSIYEQASAASRRAANLDEASLAELERRVYAGPQEFELVLREDLNAELAALTAAPSVLPYEDEYTLELDQSLRAEARVVHHRRMRRQLDAGPDVYVTHARSSLEARKARQASAAPGTGSGRDLAGPPLAGAPEVIQAAQEAAVWVGLAVGSGVVGAAPYDLLKHLISGYRQRRRDIRQQNEARLPERERPWYRDPSPPLLLDEAKALTYLAISAEKRDAAIELTDLVFLRQRLIECEPHRPAASRCKRCDDAGWAFVVGVGERLLRVWVPRGDPLKVEVSISDVW